MRPGTNLGAATPVQMGGGGLPFGGSDDKPAEGKDKGPPPKTAMEKKIVNDVTAYIRALADLRGRNAAWAEQAVREGASLPAAEAVKQHVRSEERRVGKESVSTVRSRGSPEH